MLVWQLYISKVSYAEISSWGKIVFFPTVLLFAFLFLSKNKMVSDVFSLSLALKGSSIIGGTLI